MKTLIILAFSTVIGLFASFNFSNIKNLFTEKDIIAMKEENQELKGSLYDFTLEDLQGEPVNLSDYKGKKVVIINVASKCGFTPQYADWQKFHEEHGDNIAVLGFPANNFMSQEPGTDEDIAEFCQKNYGVTFKMFSKIDVIGENQAPLFQWLSQKELNGWNNQAPTWNFCKYVINEKGQVTHFFASKIKPDNEEFLKAVGL